LTDPLLESFGEFLRRSAERPGTSHFAPVAGIRMHWLEWAGPTGAPPLLLLHGFLAHAHWWDFVAPWLATRFRIIAPDFGGMGDSEHRGEYSEHHFHEEIAGIVRATGIEGCAAVGHSFGGRALLYACHEFPDLIRRAIVVDSRLGSAEDPIRGFNEDWRPKKRYPDAASILSRFSLRPVEPAPKAALDYMGRASIRDEAGSWVWKFDENVTRLFQHRNHHGVDDQAALAGLKTPVDFIYGEESKVVTPPRAHALRDCLTHVRSVTGLPACHHHLPVSAPIALVGVLRTLLQMEYAGRP